MIFTQGINRRRWNAICFLSIVFTLSLFLTSCSIYPRSTRHTAELRSPEHLKKDVAYAYQKLEKFHPKLDWYISKQQLVAALDSLTSTITVPMTSQDFFMKLSPVIADIKQGHTQLFPLLPENTYRKLDAYEKGKGSPLAYFDFEIYNDKLYIIENKNNYPGINIGTEVVTMNGIDPQQLISDYKNTFASDGYNQTYAQHRLGHEFPGYFILRTGKVDSISCTLRYHDTIKEICLTQLQPAEKPVSAKAKEQKKENSSTSAAKEKNPPNWTEGTLRFPDPDSTTAILKINSFSGRHFYSFLKYCFQLLKTAGTQNLILDLRDNPGGSASEAATLYAYLMPQPDPFLDDIIVARKTSLMHTPYYVGQSFSTDIYLTLLLPFRILGQIISYASVKKKDDQTFYIKTGLSKPSKPYPNQFNGPLYVMINGGTFSASCLLSSNLQGSGRAIFVGEETGGAYNGTVAGTFALYQLPSSNLQLMFGLALIQPHYKSIMEGRGIFPDIKITPTLEDRMNGTDPELNWIMSQIHSAAGRN